MLIGRRNKENSAAASNSVMEMPPHRKLSASKLAETPQKLKAELLAKNKEIEHLRRLLDQANRGSQGTLSAKQKLFSCDCLERNRSAIKKVEGCIALIRQHDWSESDKIVSQDVLDVLQAGLALFFAPAQTKARVSRRHSMTSSVSTENLSEDSYEASEVLELREKIAEYEAKLNASLSHEREIEAVVEKLGEACKLSEVRASDYQSKYESVHSSLLAERKSTASLLLRVQEADSDRHKLREEVILLQADLESVQEKLKQSQKTCDQAKEVLIESKIVTRKLEKLSRELTKEKEFSEVQAYTIERLEKENSNLTLAVSERDERIRGLVCNIYREKEAEREALLNRISIADTAVSTLQLELQLKQKQSKRPDSDDEGIEDDMLSSGELPELSTAAGKQQTECKSAPVSFVGEQNHRNFTGLPLFLLSTQILPRYDSFRLVKKCLIKPNAWE